MQNRLNGGNGKCRASAVKSVIIGPTSRGGSGGWRWGRCRGHSGGTRLRVSDKGAVEVAVGHNHGVIQSQGDVDRLQDTKGREGEEALSALHCSWPDRLSELQQFASKHLSSFPASQSPQQSKAHLGRRWRAVAHAGSGIIARPACIGAWQFRLYFQTKSHTASF